MKRFILLFLTAFLFIGNVMADNNRSAVSRINIQYKKHSNNHYDLPIPADEPDVYYDSENENIIIDGMGFVSYYDVVIESATSWTIMISAQVSGNYDTIDISAFPQGMYCITIDTPMGNSYEGFFDTY